MVWRALHHPNVLPLLGVTMTENQFVMVSEWMENDNINKFVKGNPDADLLGLVCSSFEVLYSLVTDDRPTTVAWRCH